MMNPLNGLGGLSVEAFLQDYWQQKPLLVRQAFPNFESPLSPDELAGLALEEDVESRIVIEKGSEGPWEVKQGPFDASDFQQLPETDWTLLVQAVDQWVPEARELLEQFRFLPSWRLDDLMVSYAPKGGSVGPHFDYYDVFLIQGHGKRRWQVGGICDDDTPRLAGTSLRILDQFEAEQEWILEPGDMLYLPPQYAHNGVALDECLTYSVGFRAPSIGEIIDDVATDAISLQRDHQRYTDPKQQLAPAGEITPQAIAQLKQILSKALLDDQMLSNWLGRYMTTRKYPELDIGPDESVDWRTHLQNGGQLERHPASRFAFTRGGTGELTELFIDGEAVKTGLAMAELLCGSATLDLFTLQDLILASDTSQILDQLVEYGALYCD